MKFYYKAIPAKSANEVVKALEEIEASLSETEEIEVRQILTVGNSAVVVYTVYDSGQLR
jgi:hypothetical protein